MGMPSVFVLACNFKVCDDPIGTDLGQLCVRLLGPYSCREACGMVYFSFPMRNIIQTKKYRNCLNLIVLKLLPPIGF